MAKPKHHRCQVCNVVTSRYARTERAGAVNLVVWVRDPIHGEVTRANGTQRWCVAHAPEEGR